MSYRNLTKSKDNLGLDLKVDTIEANFIEGQLSANIITERSPGSGTQIPNFKNAYACSMFQNNVAAGIVSGAKVAIPFDTTAYDNDGNMANTALGRVDIQKTGIYRIYARVEHDFLASAASGSLFLIINRNGVAIYENEYKTVNINGKRTFEISHIELCNSGDFIEISTEQNSGGASDIGDVNPIKTSWFEVTYEGQL